MINNPVRQESFNIVEARIRGIKPYKLPVPFQDATMGPFEHYTIATIQLIDEDGYIGEVPTFTSLIPLFENLIFPLLLSSPRLPYSVLYEKLYWNIRNDGFRGNASTALGQADYALYDLAARRNQKSLHRYLGATKDTARVYASGGSTHLGEKALVAECVAFALQGFDMIKIKVAKNFGKNLKEDVSRVRAVRKELGSTIKLAVDANQAWTVDQALQFIRNVEEYDIAWFEEPVHSADLVAIENLSIKSNIPLAFGESEKTCKVFPALLKAGVRHFQPIAGYLSSMAEWMEVRDLTADGKVFFSSGGYSQMNCQMVATASDKAYTELLMALNGTLFQYLELAPALHNGVFYLPDEVGACMRVDWEHVEKMGMLEVDQRWKKEDFVRVIQRVN